MISLFISGCDSWDRSPEGVAKRDKFLEKCESSCKPHKSTPHQDPFGNDICMCEKTPLGDEK